ncbi:MAG: hypothetical protein ABIO71_07905, partial [Caldimonas sp.]
GMYVSSINDPGFGTKTFRLADNSWRVLDATDVASLWAGLQAHVEGRFQQFALREAAINAAATAEQVAAVTWG